LHAERGETRTCDEETLRGSEHVRLG
jgi:hypothetical protein